MKHSHRTAVGYNDDTPAHVAIKLMNLLEGHLYGFGVDQFACQFVDVKVGKDALVEGEWGVLDEAIEHGGVDVYGEYGGSGQPD